MADAPRDARLARWRSGRWLGVTAGVLIGIALLGLAAGLVAERRLADRRSRVVDRVDPAIAAALQLDAALVDQETGVRGYAIAGRQAFLQPYAAGNLVELRAAGQLAAAARDVPGLATDLARVEGRADAWRARYAQPLIRAVDRGGTRAPDLPDAAAGKAQFDPVRRAVTRLESGLRVQRAEARADLRTAARVLLLSILVTGALILAAAVAAVLTLRRLVTEPLGRVAADVRRVASGDFGHRIRRQGPREIADLSADVDSMRRRILEELDAIERARRRVERQAVELQRSNAE